jgi:putative sigma-54 modulation protein
MTEDEPIMQMDLLGHNFFVFRDLKTQEINIVYKRHNGYGVIEQV